MNELNKMSRDVPVDCLASAELAESTARAVLARSSGLNSSSPTYTLSAIEPLRPSCLILGVARALAIFASSCIA